MKAFYDIEVFPSFFCVTFKKLETKKIDQFVVFETIDEREKLKEYLNNIEQLIGFNNLHYDAPVLRYVLKSDDQSPIQLTKNLFNISAKLISEEGRYDKEIRSLKYGEYLIQELDLMKIMAFDKLGISLKQTAINLKWYKIQDLPLPYNYIVEEKDIELILKYNINDVDITEKFYERLRNPKRDIIGLREELTKLYNIDLMNASDSKMANILFEDIYLKETGIQKDELWSKRTKRDEVSLKDAVGVNIEFETNFFKRLRKEIEQTIVRKSQEFAFSKEFDFAGVHYKMGVGGLHSEDKPAIFMETDEYLIKDQDVGSLYPNIIINNNIFPAHLSKDFVRILSNITKERIAAKKAGLKVKAEGMKILINSVFGKLNSDTFWLEDALGMLKTTISGQLYILMLIEKLALNNIKVISANTDGVVCLIKRSQLDRYYEIAKEWENKTNFELEFTDYKKYIRTTVNDYIVEKSDEYMIKHPNDDSIKEKGMYVREVGLNKGYSYPIIPEVYYQYFINNKSIIETLKDCYDILDFCVSQKSGKEFSMKLGGEFYELRLQEERLWCKDNPKGKIEKQGNYSKRMKYDVDKIMSEKYPEIIDDTIYLQKNNRFYISSNGKILYKESKSDYHRIGLFVGKKVTILNDYDSTLDFSEYKIDYVFYENEAKKYIDEIEKVEINVIPEDFVDIDSDEYFVDFDEKEKSELIIKFLGMRGLPNKVVENLVKIKKEFLDTDFLNLLLYADENKYISAKWEDLIKINYFSNFGLSKKLLNIFLEFKSGKNKYSSTVSEKTKKIKLDFLRELWYNLPNEDFSIKEKLDFELAILGRIESQFNVDNKIVYVLSVDEKYSPKIIVQSLGKKVVQELKIQKKIFGYNRLSEGDIIRCKTFEKKNSVKYVDGQYIDKPNEYTWWLTSYEKISDFSKIQEKMK